MVIIGSLCKRSWWTYKKNNYTQKKSLQNWSNCSWHHNRSCRFFYSLRKYLTGQRTRRSHRPWPWSHLWRNVTRCYYLWRVTNDNWDYVIREESTLSFRRLLEFFLNRRIFVLVLLCNYGLRMKMIW